MSESFESENKLVIADVTDSQIEKNEPSTSSMSGDKPSRRVGRRPGRRSSKMDMRAKLERSRQSARECRARKKLRYQYLEDLVANREKAVFALRDELELYKQWCIQLDKGLLPLGLLKLARESEQASGGEKNGAVEGQHTNSTATATELDNSSESSDDEVEQRVAENSATISETSDIKLSVGKMKRDLSGNSKRDETIFKLPRSKVSSTNCNLEVKSEAGEFLSDLSAYSTIGISDLKPMSYSVESNKERLSTVVEGIEDVEDTHVQSNLKIELPLLPTFQD